jgi:hypothetical protein
MLYLSFFLIIKYFIFKFIFIKVKKVNNIVVSVIKAYFITTKVKASDLLYSFFFNFTATFINISIY